eukprot:3262578-Pleurochrysis_carterae.AAC.1
MWRTCCGVDAGVSEEFLELRGQELARIVRVKRTDDLPWLVGVFVDERSEGSDEAFYICGSFCFSPHRVGGFEPCVIIHEDQHVLEIGVLCAHERAGDISVNEATSVRWSVSLSFVGEFNSVGLGARGASVETAGSKRRRRIGCERG